MRTGISPVTSGSWWVVQLRYTSLSRARKGIGISAAYAHTEPSRFTSQTYRRITIKAVLQDDPQALSRAVAARLNTVDIAVTTILNGGFLALPEGDAPVAQPGAAFQRHVGPYLRKELNDAPFCRVLPYSRSAGTA